MNGWTTWAARGALAALALVATGCGGGACESMIVTVTVVDTNDAPLPLALVSFRDTLGVTDEVACEQVEGNTFECDIPTDGDYNVYAELENYSGTAQRVTPDCEADEAPSVALRMDDRIGGM